MTRRRDFLQHSAAVATLLVGVLPRAVQAQAGARVQAAFDAKSLDAALKALGLGRPVESTDVHFTAPDIAENGAVVPIAASIATPGAKRLLFLVEKNPNTLAGWFDLSDAIEPAVATRIKMAETSPVYAVAMFGDGRVLFAQKTVKVTLGGCGG